MELELLSISTRKLSSNSWWGVVVLNNLTNVVATRSHRAALSFLMLLSKSCCKHDVPILASVSFSEINVSIEPDGYAVGFTLADAYA